MKMPDHNERNLDLLKEKQSLLDTRKQLRKTKLQARKLHQEIQSHFVENAKCHLPPRISSSL